MIKIIGFILSAIGVISWGVFVFTVFDCRRWFR